MIDHYRLQRSCSLLIAVGVKFSLAFLFIATCTLHGLAIAQDSESANDVAAFVGDEAIKIPRLKLQVDLVLTKTPATGRKLEIIKAQVLEENIKQRLVNAYLQSSKFKATEAEVTLQFVSLKKDIAAQKSTLDEFLTRRGITAEQLKESIAWDLGWAKYIDNFLTESNLQKYFEKHKRQFDGTELRVAHVLIQPDDVNQLQSWEKAFAKAKQVSGELKKGKIDFEKAVIEYSSGATKISKGELGWINWRGPMAREFTISAFQLKPGEVSAPTSSAFGFHLIKLLEEKPGKIELKDIRPQVVQSVKRYLFDWLAKKQSAQTKVRFTGNYPFFEFGTKKLGKTKNTVKQ